MTEKKETIPKCEVLVEKIDNQYEINPKAFDVFKGFKNKRITVMRVFGENSLELSNIFSANNSFGDMVRKNSITNLKSSDIQVNDNEKILTDFQNQTFKIYFSYQELKDNTILIILYSGDKDQNLKLVSTLISSCLIYNLNSRETSESEIVNNVNYLNKCVLDHLDNTSEIPLDFEVEEIFPHITFLTHEEEVPIFKSEVR